METRLRLRDREQNTSPRERELFNILDSVPFAFSIVSLENRQREYFNRSFVDLFGGSLAGDLTNDLMAANISDSYIDPEKRAWNWKTFEIHRRIDSTEERRLRLDGSVWWSLSGWQPFTYQGREAVLVWNFDITDRKQAEDALHTAMQKIDTANRNLEDKIQARTKDLKKARDSAETANRSKSQFSPI